MKAFCKADRGAFTLLEVMVAILLFGMVIMAIYATWLSILQGTKSGLEAAAEVQRSRIAIRTVEDALLTAQLFNPDYYAFFADTSGDLASLSMVSRLPASFPGVGRYGDQVVRRVSFFVEKGSRGNELIMTQAPMLMDTNSGQFEPYSLTLAREVTRFSLEFYNIETAEWEEEWKYTNALPALVNVTLGLGTKPGSSAPHDEVSRIISIPGAAVTADIQTQMPQQGSAGNLTAPPPVIPQSGP